MTVLAAHHPPGGWEHLPLKVDHPRHITSAPYMKDQPVEIVVAPWMARRAVTWGPQAVIAEWALRDNRLPRCELGDRPAYEAHQWAP